ncbi:MAG: RagB/SusD family nutrient uptake outer membrane protein [Paludibacteraceae bacterium]|nr:RagB/SusD family nutrient uptake outer membrane protein [Paludibacteraceae bacterium]
MKKLKYKFAALILGLALISCGDRFLDQYPEGGTLLPKQFDEMQDNLEGSIRGLYTKLYEYGDHDTFGQRSIDMRGDIQSGDMALQRINYGWFEVYERGSFSTYARSYIWSYYYEIIHLANLGALAVYDEIGNFGQIKDNGLEPDAVVAKRAYYYAQAIAMRGWAYANLLRYYCDPMDALGKTGTDSITTTMAVPIYKEEDLMNDTLFGTPQKPIADVYKVIYEDLDEAIGLLDYYEKYNPRISSEKLEVNADVARIILAYAMLDLGTAIGYEKIGYFGDKNPYQIAEELAAQVINGGKYPLLTKENLTKTGFMDVESPNWMWGENVTVANTTGLGSFFGQVDIHSYSYAAAGDTKAIDANLYEAIVKMDWDARVDWFQSGEGDFPYCPDGKFFNPKTKHTTALDEVDRDWLCDNVFMRVEVAYLIAAEAAYKRGSGHHADAVNYLKQLCDERVLDGKEAEYTAWLATLSGDALKDAIIYNWRVEMWGEGYALQTLRRLSKTSTLGDNHLLDNKTTINVSLEKYLYQCEIPASEIRYNRVFNKDNKNFQKNK